MNDHRNINTNGGNYVEHVTGNYIQGNYSDKRTSKDLANAASEIQAILLQLETTYPTDTTSGQMLVAGKAIQHIEKNSTLRRQVINAIREGGLAALEKAIDNPAGAFITGAIQGWQDIESI
jgi:hypothetical protein